MSCWDPRSIEILLYLENSLAGEQLENLRTHLEQCPECRKYVEEQVTLTNVLREVRPLYVAPQSIRDRVAELAAQQAMVNRHLISGALFWKLLAAIALVLALIVFIPGAVQKVRAMEYVRTAVEIHRNYLHGDLPLQCLSSSPEIVTAWFAGKTLLHFQLPTSSSIPNGKAAYWLTGARLLSYRNDPAALIAYESQAEKISLVIAPSNAAVVAGGEEVHSGNLRFHYHARDKFEVITWTNHGLVYALVSARTGSPQHSCLVCHQEMAH